jgi:hypothetical protein
MKTNLRPLLLATLAASIPAAALAQTPDSAFAVSRSGASLFRVNINGGAIFGGQYDGGASSGGIPAEGAGTRMIWYPEKASFRAGYIEGTQWDDANIGYMSVSMGYNTRSSGDYSTSFGLRSTAANTSSFAAGEDNTASGAASVALGYHAHTNARQGSFVFSDRSSVDTLRAGVNHSANWRVSGGFRIFTSSNLTTGVTIQSGATASNLCSGQTNAVISTSTCAYLSTGGVWTNNSDVRRKRDFERMDGEDVLIRLRTVPMSTWRYDVDTKEHRHLGPMAQDFHRAFGLGNDTTSIGTVDADGVALSGVQALDRRTTQQQVTIDQQQRTIAAQAREIADLRARMERIEALLATQAAAKPETH